MSFKVFLIESFRKMSYIISMLNTLVRKASSTLIVKNSRFLSELFPCDNPTLAREMVKRQKEKYLSASHVVHAFVTGEKREFMGSSDAGEPHGTAGRPVLTVLRGANLTNVLLTVTRWFGGTLLGTGGLVRAYEGASKSVIAQARLENLISPLEIKSEKKELSFFCDYKNYEKARSLLEKANATFIETNFGSKIFLRVSLDVGAYDWAIRRLDYILKEVHN